MRYLAALLLLAGCGMNPKYTGYTPAYVTEETVSITGISDYWIPDHVQLYADDLCKSKSSLVSANKNGGFRSATFECHPKGEPVRYVGAQNPYATAK